MITVTPFENLGTFKNDWLDAHYHFSFAEYRDPDRRGLGVLRVWNDDTIQAQTGFDPHPHRAPSARKPSNTRKMAPKDC